MFLCVDGLRFASASILSVDTCTVAASRLLWTLVYKYLSQPSFQSFWVYTQNQKILDHMDPPS